MNRSGRIRLLAAVLVLASCTADDGSGDPPPSELSTYETISDLRTAIVDDGFDCELEYEGLEDEGRILSICVIRDEQALLTIWTDQTAHDEFVRDAAGPTVAYGENWSIDLDSAATATAVAETIGGRTGSDGATAETSGGD